MVTGKTYLSFKWSLKKLIQILMVAEKNFFKILIDTEKTDPKFMKLTFYSRITSKFSNITLTEVKCL